MLKSHKQNLVPESEFHIREERVKAQKTDMDTSTTSTKPAPTPPAEKEKRGEKREREKENGAVAALPEEAPQKTPKMKGAATAAEAKAAAEKEQQAKEKEQLAKEKEQQAKEKERLAKEKGEESKNSEAPSEVVAVSTPNSELPPAARRDGKGGSGSVTPNTKMKDTEKGSKSAENGRSSNHTKKAEGKTVVEKVAGGEGKKTQPGDNSGRRSGSKERPTSVERTPKNKPKTLAEKPDEPATPGSKTGTPVSTATGTSSPATRGARGAQNSSQNGPMGATPSPTRAGQRRQVSEMEGASDVVPEKGEFRCCSSFE